MSTEVTDGFRGVVKDGAVVFEGGVPLPDGTPVLVVVQAGIPGTPRAVLAAMTQPPSVAEEDVTALLQEVDRGKRLIQFDSPFD